MAQRNASTPPHNAVLVARRKIQVQPFTGAEVSAASMPALDSLCQAYKEGQVCLFTGAGVSFTTVKHYRTPGWWSLLEELHARVLPEPTRKKQKASFQRLRSGYSEPWDMASHLFEKAGSRDWFACVLCYILVRRTTDGDPQYKRLPRAFLDGAATLNAAIALCSRLRKLKAWPCYSPNPRVRAVLTLNYDCYLEAGATTKYQNDAFQPIASKRTSEVPGRLPVYHVHDYIPYGIGRRPRHTLVLTTQSYQEAYQPGGFARGTIDRLLSSYPTLFIGVSFNDARLLKRLEALAEREETPWHYALLKRCSSERGLLDRLERSAGVRPIVYSDHKQIPAILGHVYQSAMAAQDLSVPVEDSKTTKQVGQEELTRQDYWRLLLFNKK